MMDADPAARPVRSVVIQCILASSIRNSALNMVRTPSSAAAFSLKAAPRVDAALNASEGKSTALP